MLHWVPADLGAPAELGAQAAGPEPEPELGPVEEFAAVQPALAPAVWQEVESEPSVLERSD